MYTWKDICRSDHTKVFQFQAEISACIIIIVYSIHSQVCFLNIVVRMAEGTINDSGLQVNRNRIYTYEIVAIFGVKIFCTSTHTIMRKSRVVINYYYTNT